jgi:hypothetical protein
MELIYDLFTHLVLIFKKFKQEMTPRLLLQIEELFNAFPLDQIKLYTSDPQILSDLPQSIKEKLNSSPILGKRKRINLQELLLQVNDLLSNPIPQSQEKDIRQELMIIRQIQQSLSRLDLKYLEFAFS